MHSTHLILLICLIKIASCDINNNEIDNCNLPQNIQDEIKAYKPIVDTIIRGVISGKFKGSTYNNLSVLVDTFGSRYSGTENLENAIDYMLGLSQKLELESYGEPFKVPYWIRGNESAAMIKPYYLNLPMLGLGSSVGTPNEGIRAEVVVVASFEELENLGSQVAGKIVVFNEKYTSYGQTAVYRTTSADRASKYKAVATLIRSITPFSLNTPHTGAQFYSGNYTKIPTACITVEDANMLHRRYKRGEKIVIEIKMDGRTEEATTRNTIVNLRGKTHPEKVVIVSGHLDCWDVTNGAMDDGAAAVMSWNSLAILKSLGLTPRRTLRAVLWAGEEQGLVGASAYADAHKKEDTVFAFESDEGTFTPLGFEYKGPEFGACVFEEILKLFQEIDVTQLKRSDDVGSDIKVLLNQGIPGASLMNKNERYFWYHHTSADTLDIEDSDVLDKCTAIWTAAAYIVADLSFEIPKQ